MQVQTIKHHVYGPLHREVGDVYELPDSELAIMQTLGNVIPYRPDPAPVPVEPPPPSRMRVVRVPAKPPKDEPTTES